MESIRWRYVPEFRVRIQIDDEPADESVRLSAVPSSRHRFENYGLKSANAAGVVLCSVREHHDGASWVPSIPFDAATVFSFALHMPETVVSALQFFASGSTRFGRRIFYANNLSAAGTIDANLSGGEVQLTAAPDVSPTDSGSAIPTVFSTAFAPGTFTEFRAGRIRSGSVQNFPISETISAAQSTVGYDFSTAERGGYLFGLDGGVPVSERVFVDAQIAGSDAVGVIDIFKDNWLSLAQPRTYSVNFLSVPIGP